MCRRIFLIVDACPTELGHLGQHVRRHIPVLTVFGDDGYGHAIALRNNPFEFSLSVRSKGDDFTDVEIGHLSLDFYIAQELKSQKNLLVQIDELCFRKFVDVGHDDAKFFNFGKNAELGGSGTGFGSVFAVTRIKPEMTDSSSMLI